MSGSALGFWAYDRDPVPSGKTIAGLAAQVAGCKEDMIQCLRKVTPQQLNYGYAGYAVSTPLPGRFQPAQLATTPGR